MSFRLWLSHSTSCSCWHWHVSTGNAKEVCLIGHFGGLCCCSPYLSMHMEGMEGPRTEPCHQIYVTAMDIKFLWLKVVLTETEHCIRSGRLSSQASQHKANGSAGSSADSLLCIKLLNLTQGALFKLFKPTFLCCFLRKPAAAPFHAVSD